MSPPIQTRRCHDAVQGLVLLGILVLGLWGCRAGVSRGEIHFANGLERLALGDSAGALELLEKASYELGDDPRILYHIGRLAAAENTIEGRVRASMVLQKAVDLAPHVGVYREELGALLQRQRFMRSSAEMLSEAVRLDPSLHRAWYLLGVNMQEKYLKDLDEEALLDSAMSCFARALASNPDHLEARYRLAFLQMRRGELGKAQELLTPQVFGRECPGRFGLLLSAVEYRGRNFVRAQELITQVLDCMTWKEREPFVGLRSLIHPDSVGAYKLLSPAQKDSLSLHYWWSQDPTPTTLVNERFVEHIARVVEADFYFSVPYLGREGCKTDRGEVYQRYGAPDEMFPVHDAEVPSWTWVYGRGEKPTRFRFFDVYLNGDYVRERRTATSSFQVPIAFETTPAATRLEFKAPAGEWKYAMRFFRATDERTAVEIAYELRRNETGAWNRLALEAAGWRGPADQVAELRALVTRDELQPIPGGRLVGRLRLEVPAQEIFLGLQALALRGPNTTDVVPSRFAQHAEAEWVAFGRDTLDIEDLHRDALALSDILLAYAVHDGIGGMFDMGGVIVVPRVDSRIEGALVHLYFEIYPDSEILQEKRAIAVSYEVRSLPPTTWKFWDQFKSGFRQKMDPDRRPAVQATFLFQPTDIIERQQLTIDVSALERGPYLLTVEVVDSVSGATARRATPLELVVPAENAKGEEKVGS